MIYNKEMQEHLSYISSEDYYAKLKLKSGIMSGPEDYGDKYACPDCNSSGISSKNRKKKCSMCSGKGVVFV